MDLRAHATYANDTVVNRTLRIKTANDDNVQAANTAFIYQRSEEVTQGRAICFCEPKGNGSLEGVSWLDAAAQSPPPPLPDPYAVYVYPATL